MQKLKSIILCTFNEVNFISETILEIKKNLSNCEIIIVDDNSTDGTIDKINNLNLLPPDRLIIRKSEKGLTTAIIHGVKQSKGDYIGWIDTNMSYLLKDFNLMENLLDNNKCDIVILSRYVKDGRDERKLLRSLASKYLNLFCKLILNSKINDFTSGIFLMKKEILNEIPFVGDGHGDFFIEFLYKIEKKKYRIYELPYTQYEDKEIANSKTASNIFQFIYLGFVYILKILNTKFKN